MLRYATAPSGRKLTGPSGARIIAGEDFAPNDGLLDYSLKAINGGCAFTLRPADSARESWEAIFMHGQWRGNVFLPPVGDAQGSVPATPGVDPNVYFVNVGDQDVEPSAAAVAAAVAAEEVLSNRLLISWEPGYKLSGVQGDAQLSSIVVTGAVRNSSVATVTNTRGRLTYTIETVGGVHAVNWWSGPSLVASGSRTGNGAVACTASNASGLSVACTLTYTADVAPGVAWLDVLWPKQYQVHYSTSALSFPRTPEATVLDTGRAEYSYLSPAKAAGAYNYAIAQVADDGTVEAAPATPSDSPVTLTVPPAPPTSVAVIGSALQQSSFSVGHAPAWNCFDGTNVWVTNQSSNTVTKLLASTGALVGTYAVGANPNGVCFDGTNIWVANGGAGTVTKLLAATGALIGTYSAGTIPTGVCFDGTNVWVTNYGANTVKKLLASTGGLVRTYPVGMTPIGVCFDGTNIWVANESSNNVTKLLASTGALVGAYSVGAGPFGICFSGANVWVTNCFANTVTKLTAASGAVVGTYGVGTNPTGICVSGVWVWVANSSDDTLTMLQATTGAHIGTFSVGSGPVGICSDGTYIWTANQNVASTTRQPAEPLRVSWTAGEAGCSYDVYYGVDEPVDFAAPVAVGVDALTAALPALTNPGHDWTAALTTLLAAADGAVATATAAWTQPFTSEFSTLASSMQTALAAYATAIGQPLDQLREDLDALLGSTSAELTALTSINDPPWTAQANLVYGGFLGALGNMLTGDSTRYTSRDGTRRTLTPLDNTAKAAAGQLGTVHSVLRVIVRATKSGVHETFDAITSAELDATTGSIVLPRPNPATIESIAATGNTLAVTASMSETNAAVAAAYFDLYVVAVGAAITLASPSASVAAGSILANARRATVSYAAASGWKDIVVLTRAADGTRCMQESRTTRYVGDPDPGAPSTVSATAQRSE